MSDETLNLYPDKDGKFEVLQLTLQEENYCQLRAEGESRRAAWKTAYGVDGVNLATLDTRINRLEKRPEIIGRIAEIHREIVEANASKWAKRREELMEILYTGAKRVARDPEQGGLTVAVKAISQLAALLGWNEPQRLELTATASGAIDAKEVERKVDRLLQLAEGGDVPKLCTEGHARSASPSVQSKGAEPTTTTDTVGESVSPDAPRVAAPSGSLARGGYLKRSGIAEGVTPSPEGSV